jgi:hypothetical protein
LTKKRKGKKPVAGEMHRSNSGQRMRIANVKKKSVPLLSPGSHTHLIIVRYTQRALRFCMYLPPYLCVFHSKRRVQQFSLLNSLFSIENKRKEQIVLGFIWLPLGFRWMGMRMFFISLSPFFSSNELKESNEDKIKRCGSSCDDCDYTQVAALATPPTL